MKEILKISTGGSFGELALINDEPRAATVKTLSECAFGVLKQKDFMRILKKAIDQHNDKKLDFFL